MQPSPEFLKAVSIFERARELFTNIFYRVTTPHLETTPRIDKSGLERYLNHFNSRADDLADKLGNGDITVREWRTAMQTEVERLQTTSYVIGRGGIDQMSREDMDAIRREIQNQMNYLDHWAAELQPQVESHMGTLLPDDVKKLKDRAHMYAGSANATLTQATVTRLGMPPLPFRPGVGSQCLTNCKCDWDFELLDGDGNWNAYWRRHVDDSCDQCIAREKACNPLEIRDGVVQPFDEAGTMV